MSFWYLQFSQKTNEKIPLYFFSTLSQIVFVHFLGELKTPKRHFEINWPLTKYKSYKYKTCALSSRLEKKAKGNNCTFGVKKPWNVWINRWKTKLYSKCVLTFKKKRHPASFFQIIFNAWDSFFLPCLKV